MKTVDPEYAVINETRDCTLAKHVRIAVSSGSRRRGLLGVSTMDPDSGLWIYPCEAIHTFGMKIPIDTIFLDRQGRVKKVRPNLVASRIAVCLTAHSVLELASGVIERSCTQVGDRLRFSAHPAGEI